LNGVRFLPALGSDLALILALVLAGWLLASWLLGRRMWLEALGFAFPLGGGLFAVMLFVLSLAGVPLTAPVVLGTLCLLIVGLAVVRFAARLERPGTIPDSRPAPVAVSRGEWLPLSVCAGLFLASLVVSLGRSYSTWDSAAIWSVKGYGIASEGSIWAASEWGAHGLAYPPNIPLQIAAFFLLDGDVLPGSKFIFPTFYASLALGLLAHWRHNLTPAAAAWATAFVMTVPVVFDHATDGYANLPFAIYVVLGVLSWTQAAPSGDAGFAFLSGALWGLAVWTRPEGGLVIAVLCAALLLAHRWTRRPAPRLAAWLTPCLLLGGAWVLFGRVGGDSGMMPGAVRAAAAAIGVGDLHADSFYWIGRFLGRELLRPSVWGLTTLAFAAGSFAGLRRGRQIGQERDLMVLWAAAVTGLSVVGFYYLVSFVDDVTFWLGTGASRMFFPGILLALVWALSTAMQASPDAPPVRRPTA
jgi:hypothetical protein